MTVSLQEVSDIIKVVGLVAGGLWTAWTFHKLQKVRAAEVENNRMLAEIQKSRLEQQEMRTRLLRQQPQFAIELKVVETVRLTGTPKDCLGVTVTLKNEGDQNMWVQFDDSTLIVGRIVFEKNGKQTIKELHRFEPWYFIHGSDTPHPLSERGFRVGARRQLAFAVPITEPGAYFVQFYAVYAKVPFEGEKVSRKAPAEEPIAAIEQTIHFATGTPSES